MIWNNMINYFNRKKSYFQTKDQFFQQESGDGKHVYINIKNKQQKRWEKKLRDKQYNELWII